MRRAEAGWRRAEDRLGQGVGGDEGEGPLGSNRELRHCGQKNQQLWQYIEGFPDGHLCPETL